MSKLIVAFHRHAPDIAEAERRARRCLSEITPDIFRAGARIETRIETRTEAAGAGHQVLVIGEVVPGQQHHRENFAGLHEVMQVGA